MVYIIGGLVSAVVFGLISRYIAQSKGYEGGFFWGFFLGIIGLLVVGFRPDISGKSGNPGTGAVPKGMWACAECGASNPESAKFCGKCGQPRRYEWACSKCGTHNAANVKFCLNCGKEKEQSEEIIEEVPVWEKESTYTRVDDRQIKCDQCGEVQSDTRLDKRLCCFCLKCGAQFTGLSRTE